MNRQRQPSPNEIWKCRDGALALVLYKLSGSTSIPLIGVVGYGSDDESDCYWRADGRANGSGGQDSDLDLVQFVTEWAP